MCYTIYGDTECHWETYWDVTCADPTLNPEPLGPDPDAVGPAELPGGVNPRDLDQDGETDCYVSLVYAPNRETSVPLEPRRNLGGQHGGPDDGFRWTHNGIDVRAERGDPVFAARSGTVRRVDTGHGNQNTDDPAAPSNGNYVRIDYDGGVGQGVYLHLEGVNVAAGERVLLGTQIGTADDSGNSFGDHLHYTRWVDNNPANGATIMGNCQ